MRGHASLKEHGVGGGELEELGELSDHQASLTPQEAEVKASLAAGRGRMGIIQPESAFTGMLGFPGAGLPQHGILAGLSPWPEAA